MENLVYAERPCSICGEAGRCFQLNAYNANYFLHTAAFDLASLDLNKTGEVVSAYRYGCLTCLTEGKFVFVHETEFGVVHQNGFKSHVDPAPQYSPEAIEGLLRTPHFRAVESDYWLTHCGDFMTYRGDWLPKDFAAHATDFKGAALFAKVCAADPQVWNSPHYRFPDRSSYDWTFACQTFECKHCGALRAYPEVE